MNISNEYVTEVTTDQTLIISQKSLIVLVRLNNLGATLLDRGDCRNALQLFKDAINGLKIVAAGPTEQQLKFLEDSLIKARSQVNQTISNTTNLECERRNVSSLNHLEISLTNINIGNIKTIFNELNNQSTFVFSNNKMNYFIPIRLDEFEISFENKKQFDFISAILCYNLAMSLLARNDKINNTNDIKALQGSHKLLSLSLQLTENLIEQSIYNQDGNNCFELLTSHFIRYLCLCHLNNVSRILSCTVSAEYCQKYLMETKAKLQSILYDPTCICSSFFEAAQAA